MSEIEILKKENDDLKKELSVVKKKLKKYKIKYIRMRNEKHNNELFDIGKALAGME